jgi:hypothetical protein
VVSHVLSFSCLFVSILVHYDYYYVFLFPTPLHFLTLLLRLHDTRYTHIAATTTSRMRFLTTMLAYLFLFMDHDRLYLLYVYVCVWCVLFLDYSAFCLCILLIGTIIFCRSPIISCHELGDILLHLFYSNASFGEGVFHWLT